MEGETAAHVPVNNDDGDVHAIVIFRQWVVRTKGRSSATFLSGGSRMEEAASLLHLSGHVALDESPTKCGKHLTTC